MPVGEDIILPHITIPPSFSCENDTSLYTREALVWFSPYYLVLPLLIVGDGVLDVPFIKISLRFARTTGGRPYRRCVVLSFLIVGTVRPYLLCKLTVLKIGRALAVEHSETGMRTERSIGRITERDPSVVGEPLPRLFSPDTVEKRFDAAAIVSVSPYLTNISPLCSG